MLSSKTFVDDEEEVKKFCDGLDTGQLVGINNNPDVEYFLDGSDEPVQKDEYVVWYQDVV